MSIVHIAVQAMPVLPVLVTIAAGRMIISATSEDQADRRNNRNPK